MSRPSVTDDIVRGLSFARACVLDQRTVSRNRKDHAWDKRYIAALSALDLIQAAKKRASVTDDIVEGLSFARACVLDQRAASHNRKDHKWDKSYDAALSAIDLIVGAHKRSVKKRAGDPS